jgi:hypothetical protein
MLAVGLLCLVGAAAVAPDYSSVELSLTASHDAVSVGESTKLRVTRKIVRPIAVIGGIQERLWVDNGAGFRAYAEVPEEPDTIVAPRERTYAVGQDEDGVDFVVGVESDRDGTRFAFPAAGQYRFKAKWGSAESNVVTITVREASPEDRDVLARLKAYPELLAGSEHALQLPGNWELVQDVLRRHGSSPLVPRLRLRVWEVLSKAPNDHPEDAVIEAERTDFGTSPFEEDRLYLVGSAWARLGRKDGASRAYTELTQRFPRGKKGRAAQKWIQSQAVELPR